MFNFERFCFVIWKLLLLIHIFIFTLFQRQAEENEHFRIMFSAFNFFSYYLLQINYTIHEGIYSLVSLPEVMITYIEMVQIRIAVTFMQNNIKAWIWCFFPACQLSCESKQGLI